MQNSKTIINKGTDDQLYDITYTKGISTINDSYKYYVTSPKFLMWDEWTPSNVCTAYCISSCKTFIYYLFCILSFGILVIVAGWKETWFLKLRTRSCYLSKAEYILIVNSFGQASVIRIQTVTTDNRSVNLAPFILWACCLISTATCRANDADTRRFRYFVYRHLRYAWVNNTQTFVLLSGLDKDITCAVLHDDFRGISDEQRQHRLLVNGENSIDIELKSYPKLFLEEVFNPFYVFQICSVIIWCSEEYYIYAACIVFISLLSLATSLYEIRKQSITLHDMIASRNTDFVMVYTDNKESIHSIPINHLVAGDLLLLPSDGFTMPCDAILISGNAIVNESMLTGESVPVTKTPVAPSEAEEKYNPELHKRHTLFSGTKVIQTRFYGDSKVICVVSRTGFNTAKGELVRSILNPRPIGLKFYKDSLKFIACLSLIALVGMAYSIYNFIISNATLKIILLRGLDIITVVVPPALPAAMTVGTVYAQNRLKKTGIFCISPARINVCGKLKLFCFDKTGTLTEDGLDIWGVVPAQVSASTPSEPHFVTVGKMKPSLLDDDEPIKIAMATCHSLTLIDNVLTGDPLDLSMFESIHWTLEEPGAESQRFDSLIPTIVRPSSTIRDSYDSYAQNRLSNIEVGVVRQFTFSSHLQRMSVITRQLGDNFMCFNVKGAPEVIVQLCRPETVPSDFQHQLHHYTMKGYRVIAFASKPLDSKITWLQVHKIKRDTLETNLQFLGLLIMENTLKPETTPVISELKQAHIRSVMVTGDNILTAVSVARQCSMIDANESIIKIEATPPISNEISDTTSSKASIQWNYVDEDKMEDPEMPILESLEIEENAMTYQRDNTKMQIDKSNYHFAIDGPSFSVIFKYFPHLIDKICVKGTVFARMSPDQKTLLVESLQNLGYTVGMCGDGANDCGALKAADAGISLSDAEASVASPFTSKNTNIKCVLIVIREGRAALVTSFGVFKYMALYSLIQFISLLILYTELCNLSDFMFLYIDLVITTTVAVFMGHSDAYHKLAVKRPAGSLFSYHNIIGILINICVISLFQIGTFIWLSHQSWYHNSQSLHPNNTSVVNSYETTAIFTVSSFQYLTLAFAYSKGPPYRQPIWRNKLFLLSLIAIGSLTTVISLIHVPYVTNLLKIMIFPDFNFSLSLIGISFANFLLCVFIESVVLESYSFKYIINLIRRKKKFGENSKNRYKYVTHTLEEDTVWPPIGVMLYA